MKQPLRLLAIAFALALPTISFGQSVGVAGTAITPDPDAILELRATDKGFLLPRMDTGQRGTYTAAANGGAGLGAGEKGMTIFNTSTNEYNFWDGTQWVMVGGTTTGAGFIENQITAAQASADFWVDGKGVVNSLGVGTTATLSSRLHIHDASATGGQSLLLIDDNANAPVLQVQDIGRVGIGTAGPTATLDVVGKEIVRFGSDALVVDPGYITGPSLAYGTTTIADNYMRSGYNGTLNYIDTKGEDFHLYSTATTPGFYFDESNGFVGIGTSAPSHLLHVENNTINNTIQDVLKLQVHNSVIGNGGGIQFSNRWSGGSTYWTMARITAIEQNGFGGQLIFSTNSGTGLGDDVTPEAMRINENGNVGIGTNNPVQRLHVVSTSNGDGTWDEGIHIENTGTTAGEAAMSFSNIATGANYWMTGLNQSDDYDISYGTTFTNGNTKLRILENGRVGIGTIGPTQMLHVVGNGRFTTLGGGGNAVVTTDNTGVMGKTALTGNANDVYNGAGAFIPATSLSVTGDNLGNHAATAILDMNNFNINEVGALSINDPGDQEGILWTGTAAKIFVSPLNSGNSDGYLRLINDGGIVFEPGAEDTEQVTFTAAGNVGIGSTTPSAALEIYGDSKEIEISNTAETDVGIIFNDAQAVGSQFAEITYMSGTGNDLNFRNGSATPRMVIESNGDVGIGTVNPGQRLSVYPNTNVSAEIGRAHVGYMSYDDWAGFSHVDRNSAGNYALMQNGSGRTLINCSNGQDIEFRENNTTHMIIDQDGDVGIGNTNPTYKLHVSGRLRTTGINETSDVRLKKDINPIDNALENVLQMRGVTYNWRTEEFPEMGLNEDIQHGLIAQELEEIIPDLVLTDEEGFKSIEYTHLVPVLIEALKEQNQIIQGQASDISDLKSQASITQKQLLDLIDQVNGYSSNDQ